MSAGSPLLLLAIPSTARLLADLADGPRSLAELRRHEDSPPATTFRGYLRALAAADIVEKHRHAGFAGTFDYRLSAAGRDLKGVEEAVAAWLAASPCEPVPLGTVQAKRAIRTLVGSWASGAARALAPAPLTLVELSTALPGLSYPATERRLSAMRRLGLVDSVPESGLSTRFAAADWLRLSVVPLAAAARWERRWRSGPAPIATGDVEAALLLVIPALRPLGTDPVSCRLTVERGDGAAVTFTAEPDAAPPAWLRGSPGAWMSTLFDHDSGRLELGGDARLAAGLVDELRRELNTE